MRLQIRRYVELRGERSEEREGKLAYVRCRVIRKFVQSSRTGRWSSPGGGGDEVQRRDGDREMPEMEGWGEGRGCVSPGCGRAARASYPSGKGGEPGHG